MSTITVIGYLSADPELRYTSGGAPVCSFRLGEKRRIGRGDDARDEWVNYDCRAWGDLGEHIRASLDKGDRVLIVGEMRSEEYTNNAGEKRSKLVLVADDAGPALRFATCMIEKVSRERG